MKTIILGGGIAGITAAYYLAKSGREVVVIDRQSGVARETSYANAGLVAPGHAYTWASPKAPKILLKSLFLPGQALRLKLRLDPSMWSWGLDFLKQCTAERAAVNTARKLRLCLYSQEKLKEITQKEGLLYDRIEGGLLYVYRDEPSFQRGCAAMSVLSDNGLKLQTLTPEQVAQREPSLAGSRDKIAGAIFCPSDESGDAHMFSNDLAQRCKEMGATFHMNCTIEGIAANGDRVMGVRTSMGDIKGDEFVLSMGSYSPLLAKNLGYRIPVYPVKGYSLTVPVRANDEAPTMGGVDENNLVAWARLGDRLRFTATAEFAGYDTQHKPSDFQHMIGVARELFPRGADYESPSYWSCLRPMTPAGAPILGRTRHKNLFMNTGHGHMGWTMACGTGQIVADIMNNKKPDIDLEGMTLS